ncbi:LysR family transcriptional regulator [Methylobacterium persicinum]|uniref:DNA-binding transcriptional LysR family regulator n=1 Tax=Methylobacterium persicinum TaxID=374426 RepID=A0ABU0HRZ2_9HYPH|nr:LysR family transcriptional regulator [Methylobacterium persicinum]MDQ0444236.1 DNA-binding transcriptional LysR family regulator [Methylobacterium persicinum]GJE39622.1 HTH-type transcriptional regulator ArgP [Methylobacterium persicinum]
MRRPGGSAQIPTGPATPQEMATPAILNRLDLKTLRLFAAICEDGTLNGAARRAAIAPSAVSKRLAELERALGCQLLARGPKGMRPTPAGETLLHHTRRMLASAEQISLELAEHARGVRGFVRVLANLSAIVQFLPDDLQAFLAAQGEIRVDLEERPSTGVVTGVEDGAADLGICAGGTDTRSLDAYPYRRDRLVLVVPAGHPLAGRDSVSLAETLDHDHVGMHRESSIYTALRDEARRLGRPLKLRIHVPSFDAICRMTQAGMGLGVVPEGVHALLGPQMNVAAVPLSDPFAQRTLLLVVRPGALTPAPALLFAHLRAAG